MKAPSEVSEDVIIYISYLGADNFYYLFLIYRLVIL